MKKTMLIIIVILLALVGTYLVGSGFFKIGSVYIDEYSLSEDGKEITLYIGNFSSIGYIRKLAIHQREGGKMYIDCYSAFGGINGRIGARAVYTLPLDESTTMIAIYRNTNAYDEVLQKDTGGEWKRVK